MVQNHRDPIANRLDADTPPAIRIDGTATYSDFRQFAVDTKAIIR